MTQPFEQAPAIIDPLLAEKASAMLSGVVGFYLKKADQDAANILMMDEVRESLPEDHPASSCLLKGIHSLQDSYARNRNEASSRIE